MRPVHLGLIVLALLLAACNVPRAADATGTPDLVATQVAVLRTNQPTSTSTPPPASPTPEPSPTAPAPETASPPPPTGTPTQLSNLVSSLGQPTWVNTLDSGSAFYQFENEGTRVTVENGAMLLTGLQANDWLGWSLTYSRQPKNFYLEGIFITQACSGADRYGLVFRAPDDNAGYFFSITCGGRYSLAAANYEDNSENSLSSGSNPAIATGAGQTNRLAVLANGDQIGLYANDILLQEVTDATFTDGGYFGAFVAANETPGFTVQMDEIRLWELP